jgi:predicted solute-binding protein
MLSRCDAALVIGDPALAIDPLHVPYRVLDLGDEWTSMTGLPMVFAVWAARPDAPGQDSKPFSDSLSFGLEHLEQIVREYHSKVGISVDLARKYLTEHIVFELGGREYEGLERFLQYAAELETRKELSKASV